MLVGMARAQFQVDDMFAAHTYTNASGATLNYQLAAPQFPLADKQYPLVLFLHGSGECGTDNYGQLKVGLPTLVRSLQRRSKPEPVLIVAPQCQHSTPFVANLALRTDYHMPPNPTLNMRLVLELVEYLVAHKQADPQRLYITGLSLGGFATWDAIQRHPDLFAAAVPICGGGDVHLAKTLKHLPLWVFHGSEDPNVPVDVSRKMTRALQKAGNRRLTYIEYEGAGHNVWDRAYGNLEMIEWLLTRKRGRQTWWKFWER